MNEVNREEWPVSVITKGGRILPARESAFVMTPTDGLTELTDHELETADGHLWTLYEGSWLISDDGEFGRFLVRPADANECSESVLEKMKFLKELRDCPRGEIGYSLWMAQTCLYGTGSLTEFSYIAQTIVQASRNCAEPLAKNVTAFERDVEGMVELQMKRMNDVIDEQGYAEEIWWDGWEEFKRPKWEDKK